MFFYTITKFCYLYFFCLFQKLSPWNFIPIPSALLKERCNPFFRAKNTRSIKGHGVGLALSKAIIEKMGGKVSVHSIEGEGTTLDIKV